MGFHYSVEVPICPVPAEIKLFIYFFPIQLRKQDHVFYSWMYFFRPLSLSLAVSSTSSGLHTAKRR